MCYKNRLYFRLWTWVILNDVSERRMSYIVNMYNRICFYSYFVNYVCCCCCSLEIANWKKTFHGTCITYWITQWNAIFFLCQLINRFDSQSIIKWPAAVWSMLVTAQFTKYFNVILYNTSNDRLVIFASSTIVNIVRLW